MPLYDGTGPSGKGPRTGRGMGFCGPNTSDYKYWIQNKAEELAQDRYNAEFYDLDSETQNKLMNEAQDEYNDTCASMADDEYDRRMDH